MGFFPTDAINDQEVGPNANGTYFKYVAADDKWIIINVIETYTEAEVDALLHTEDHDNTYHTTNYEPANANIQSHVTVSHEPANANIQSHVTVSHEPANANIQSHVGGTPPTSAHHIKTVKYTAGEVDARIALAEHDTLLLPNGNANEQHLTAAEKALIGDAYYIETKEIDTTGISDTKILKYNGTKWVIADDSTGGAGADTDAIHDNVANEITAITLKTPVAADEFVLEDSAASYIKKSATIGSIPVGGNFTGNVNSITHGSTQRCSHTHASMVASAILLDSSNTIDLNSLGNIYATIDGTRRWWWSGSLYTFMPYAGNTYDIGTASYDLRYLYYCNLSDTSCADFSHLSAETLYNMFKQIKPRTDNIKHKIDNGMLFNHIDFSTIPDEFANKAKEDFTKENVSTATGITTVDYKIGDVCGIEKGTWDYAIKDLVVKQYEMIKALELRIIELEK